MSMASAAAGSGAPAGFLLRLVASIIDGVILGIVVGIIYFILGQFTGGNPFLTFAIVYLIGGVLGIVYWGQLESGKNQATFGKKVMNIKVTSASGGTLDFSKAAMRSWVHWLGMFAIAIDFFIGWGTILGFVIGIAVLITCIAVGFKANKQGFHDDFANAQVIRA